jgi:gluconokinase
LSSSATKTSFREEEIGRGTQTAILVLTIYWVGMKDDPTHVDARCTRFLNVDYDELAQRTLQGGSDEEILEWCFQRGRRPSEEEIEIWNAFLLKRGWRDESRAKLEPVKKEENLAGRDDIQTWVDPHDAGEGRRPRSAS